VLRGQPVPAAEIVSIREALAAHLDGAPDCGGRFE
jgi:hypothetical protein